jgi:CheY-like chemotaxis protein
MHRPRIVIMDDDRDHLKVLRAILKDEGYAVATADDLRTGYQLVSNQAPMLVILDLVQDGRIVGLDLIRRFRDDPETRDLPIIVVSADAPTLRAYAERFRSDGVGVLEKPYELDDLLALVRERIGSDRPVSGR